MLCSFILSSVMLHYGCTCVLRLRGVVLYCRVYCCIVGCGVVLWDVVLYFGVQWCIITGVTL